MNLKKMKKYENHKTHILHICIPFTKKFIINVKKLVKQFDPEILVIHSTISPSTTSNLQSKLDAYACYKKEVRPGDHPRSLDSLKTLAKFRGNSVGRPYAEAFVVIRHISDD